MSPGCIRSCNGWIFQKFSDGNLSWRYPPVTAPMEISKNRRSLAGGQIFLKIGLCLWSPPTPAQQHSSVSPSEKIEYYCIKTHTFWTLWTPWFSSPPKTACISDTSIISNCHRKKLVLGLSLVWCLQYSWSQQTWFTLHSPFRSASESRLHRLQEEDFIDFPLARLLTLIRSSAAQPRTFYTFGY